MHVDCDGLSDPDNFTSVEVVVFPYDRRMNSNTLIVLNI